MHTIFQGEFNNEAAVITPPELSPQVGDTLQTLMGKILATQAQAEPAALATLAVGDGTTDDRAAIVAALDVAEALAVAGGSVTVMLGKRKTYRVVPTLYTASPGGATGYGCIPMPSNVRLDLNGSTINGHFTGTDDLDGCVVFPKGFHTAVTNYGAASNWCVRNGKLTVTDASKVRVGNMMVFGMCENVLWEDLYIGQCYYHACDIGAGRNLTLRRVRIDNTNSTSHPAIQFDFNGNATIPRTTSVPTMACENVLFQEVTLEGFKPEIAANTRCVEFGHSAGVYRNITFYRCRFDGCYGAATGDTVETKHIVDLNNVQFGNLENIIFRECYFNHDCVGGESACIGQEATSLNYIDGLTVENCYFTGNYTAAVKIGSTDFATSPGGSGLGARRNIRIVNNVAAMGQWSTMQSGGTYNARPAATQTTSARAFGFALGKCDNVTLYNNRVILPAAFGSNVNARTYTGFWMMNNVSTDGRNNTTEFWNTVGSANAPAAGSFNGARVDCDEVVNSMAMPCYFSWDGFEVDTRKLYGVSAATSDIFTSVAHWLTLAEPVTLEFLGGFTGITSGTTYFAGTITADTFKLYPTAADAAASTNVMDITATGAGAILRKARVFNYAYQEDPITAGAEARLNGMRRGISVRATPSTATASQPVLLYMTLGEEKTVTAAGTTGAQTIHKAGGRVNFAAAATSLVVTNELVSARSVITATIGTNDATAAGLKAVPAAGSFTLYLGTAPTAETAVNWRID